MLHRTPVRVVLVRDLDETRPCTLALATTDLTANGEQIVARYASRWSIEQSIKDGKQLLGAGDAQNRLPAAVERATPLSLANLTILVLWCERAGRPAADLSSRRHQAPWYRHKRRVSIEDMIVAFRQTRITDNTAAQTHTRPIRRDPPRPAKLPPRNGETSAGWRFTARRCAMAARTSSTPSTRRSLPAGVGDDPLRWLVPGPGRKPAGDWW